MTRALITGITGQDGSYLAEFLLEKGYSVCGLVRRSSTDNLKNIKHLLDNDNFVISYGDLTDASSIDYVIHDFNPYEIYNLGAMSFVPVSWGSAHYTVNTNTLGAINILESLRERYMYGSDTKYYQASTSEMFGKVREIPQRESTPFYPRSPYGVSKVAAYWATVNYRESHDIFALNGILFNHESPRRGEEFVTRKITKAVANIYAGNQDKLYLGNLDAKRDWGHSKDYVRAMWMMLQQEEPEDYVIGSGETHSVREFCELAFGYFNMNYEDHVEVSPEFYRPAEVDILISDPSKAREKLGWKPEYSFKDLVHDMVSYDWSLIRNERNR